MSAPRFLSFAIAFGALLALTHPSPAAAGVVFFVNNSAGFLAAMAGSTSLGTEDFEGSTLGAGGILGVDDPLSQSVANGPYPSGLTLPMTVQSNLSGGVPTTPNPRGAAGLAALSPVTGFGEASKVVISNFFVDSLDWIFSSLDKIVGLGFDTLSYLGAATVDITVYDTNNALLGVQSIAADPAGTNFLGVQATGGDLIGRINFFDPGNGVEGGDNAQLFSATVPEPTTLAILGLGLAGLGFVRRKQAA